MDKKLKLVIRSSLKLKTKTQLLGVFVKLKELRDPMKKPKALQTLHQLLTRPSFTAAKKNKYAEGNTGGRPVD